MSLDELEPTTNYLSPQDFSDFAWGLVRLETFHSDRGRPAMNADAFLLLFELQYDTGMRIGEVLNLRKQDFNLERRIVTITKSKTRKGKPQKTTITPYMIFRIKPHLAIRQDNEKLFSADRQAVWRIGKDAGRLAGLPIFEAHNERDYEGGWTHLFRKSCSKRMQDLGASRELRMLKLRHSDRDIHDPYDRLDLNALLNWESEHTKELIFTHPYKRM
jgi:integrase